MMSIRETTFERRTGVYLCERQIGSSEKLDAAMLERPMYHPEDIVYVCGHSLDKSSLCLVIIANVVVLEGLLALEHAGILESQWPLLLGEREAVEDKDGLYAELLEGLEVALDLRGEPQRNTPERSDVGLPRLWIVEDLADVVRGIDAEPCLS
jgi:hypothetical protein